MNLSVLQNDNSSSLHSPSGAGVATAKYPSFNQVALESHHAISSSDSISCSSLSPIASTISASSPTSSISAATQQSFFQQGLLLDPRSPALLIQPSLTAAVSPTASQLTEENMDESGPFVCCWENCNQEFQMLESLVMHLDRGHTISMDKYVCLWKDCARSRKPFDARYKLITHLRCHTGEKPYKCEYPTCTRSFSRLENLKLHVRTHTGEKPYECHYEGCTKKFNNTSDRAKHMKTHITRKPYVCKYPGCGKSYTDPSSMRKHIKYTHKLKERQEEAGHHHHDGMMVLSNGPLSHHRRKRESSSTSGSSASPTTPNAQAAARFVHPLPNIHGAVTIGHSINGQLIQTLPSPTVLSSTSGNTPVVNSNGTAVTLSTNQIQQPQLIPVPLVHLPGAPSSTAQPVSFIPSLAQASQIITQGGAVAATQPQPQPTPQQHQQQQVVMLLPSPAMAANAGRDIVAISSPQQQNATVATKIQQQQRSLPQLQQQQNFKQPTSLPPIQVLQQAASVANNGQIVETVPTSAATLTVINEEEQLRLQIAHLQQQLLQSQQAQLIAQQQVAQLQMKHHHHHHQTNNKAGLAVEQLNEKQIQTSLPVSSSQHGMTTLGGSPVKISPPKFTIVTSSWPGCDNSAAGTTATALVAVPPTTSVNKSQTLITSRSSSPPPSSPPHPLSLPPSSSVARKASGQILLTSSVPILSPTGQTTVLPTQLPVMLGQPTAPPVIPIVQSQGVSQRQILYMTPSTS